MKIAIVGTYPAGTFEKFKNYFFEKPEIEVVEVDTQEKFDALLAAHDARPLALWYEL